MGTDEFTSATRIESFSDAVLAIIITIMVLEFRLPAHSLDRGIWAGFIEPTAPKIMSYALSFVLLTSMWIGHHAMMQGARSATPRVMWANNNLLFWLSLVPFVTSILGDEPSAPVAVAIYGAALAAATWSFVFLRWLVIKEGSVSSQPLAVQYAGLKKAMLAGGIYMASVLLAFISIYIALALFVLGPSMFFYWHMKITKQVLARSVAVKQTSGT